MELLELLITTIFNLSIVFAIDKIRRDRRTNEHVAGMMFSALSSDKRAILAELRKCRGEMEAMRKSMAITEKFADRAWNTANAATLGVVALQKAQASKPRIRSYNQAIHDKVAEKKLEEIFEEDDLFGYLEPFANEDEMEVIDKIRQKRETVVTND